MSTENQSSERSPVVHSVARRAVVAFGALLLGLFIGLFIAIAGLLVFGRIVSKIPGYEPSAFWASVGLFVAIALAYGLIVVLVAVVTQLIGGKVGELGGRAVRWLSQGVFAVAIIVMLLLASTSPPPVAGLSRSDIERFLGTPWKPPSFGSTMDARVAEIAFRHRPILLFDGAERLRPLDVLAFLRETDDHGAPVHQWCERRYRVPDTCHWIRGVDDLRAAQQSSLPTYIDVGRETTDPPSTASRIYYQTVPTNTGGYLLDYWWFFRYNRSPVRSDWFCLAGLSIASVSCFDHESDWEGVTVETDLLGNAVNVTYSGHHWPGYRYLWSRLEARGITDGGHPKVFVAYGSHASYPVPCVGDHGGLLGACDQRDYRYHLKKGLIDLELKLSDGRHDGKGAWLANLDDLCRDRDCLAALPVEAIANSLAGTRPASWNAYDGLWGRAQCSVTTAFCLRINGPQSPGLQRRFENPSLGVEGSDDSLIPR